MSGYINCACRDCFEIAIGEVGDLCTECAACGCSAAGDRECFHPDAYGGDEQDYDDHNNGEAAW